MIAITLWQPWATLIAIGAKRIETRSWNFNYRGPLAIHAALRLELDTLSFWGQEPFRTALVGAGIRSLQDMPFGAIVAVCDLVDVQRITAANIPAGDERAYGDYRPGRYAWHLANIKKLDPIPATGKRGPWIWEPSLVIKDDPCPTPS